MYYDLKLTLLGQLRFLVAVVCVNIPQIYYVSEHLRSDLSKIDENLILCPLIAIGSTQLE